MWYSTVQWIRENRSLIFQFLGVILIGILCFEAGLIQGKTSQTATLVVSLPATPDEPAAPVIPESKVPAAPISSSGQPVVYQEGTKNDCAFVGSKNSNKYHLPSCTAAKRIRIENRVCFSSKEEAERRGYVPSCLK